MAKYVVEDTNLKSIADGFRASRNTSWKLTLAQMAALAATPLEVEEQLHPADLPGYVRAEVLGVAQKVRNVLADDSIVYMAMSDTHYAGDEAGAWNREQNNVGNIHTAMAAKALAYALPLDFVAHLGDVGNGANTTTPEELKAQIKEFVSYFNEADGNIPCFIAIGNHDPGIYYHDKQTDGAVHTVPGCMITSQHIPTVAILCLVVSRMEATVTGTSPKRSCVCSS